MVMSRRMRWARHVARMGETKNSYRILVEMPEGKRPLVRRWVENIKLHLIEIGCGVMHWIDLDHDRDQ